MPRRSARDSTQAEVRKAARGNVAGFLGMAELAKLTGKPAPAPLGPLPPAKADKR